jgi:hypothetical protein
MGAQPQLFPDSQRKFEGQKAEVWSDQVIHVLIA